MNANILIIDDEAQLRKLLGRIISLEGFKVFETDTLKAAMELLSQQPIDVVLCDVRLPDGNGVEFVKSLKRSFPTLEIILLTAYGNIPDSVNAIKNGAFDYIVKGDENSRIVPLLYQAVEKVLLTQKSSVTIHERRPYDFSSIIGRSPLIKQAIDLAKKIAATDTTVLLLGETGTGKEVFANAIHQNSQRKKQTLVAINCSAFNRELLEAELFGHKAGAFTGATKDKKGLVEVAEGGTLFLDEVGELPLELQAKILRFLENGEFIKLGDTKISRVQVRIIAATNRDLELEVTEGRFRQDLYYRLNVFVIKLPALRDRVEDIPELVDQFLSDFAQKENKDQLAINNSEIEILKNHDWKGNIRELKNTIQRASILMEGEEILPEHLPYEFQMYKPSNSKDLSLAEVEKKHIQKILEHTKGNKTRAAQLLNIGLATLYRKLEEYKITGTFSK